MTRLLQRSWYTTSSMDTEQQPMSIRVSPLCRSYLERQSRQRRRPRGELVRELTDEAIKARMFPGVAFRGTDDDRRAWVTGTGFDVWQIVEAYHELGSIEAVLDQDSSVSEQALRLALAYYRRFTEEIDQAIEENNRSVEDLLEVNPLAEVSVPPK